MVISLSTLYVMIHLLAVFALATAPFIFFSVYADDTQNEWKITIPNGASGQGSVQGFYPNQLPVLVGDTIVWENEDSVTHSITSGVPEHPEHSGIFFNLGEVTPGKSVSHVMPDTEFLAFYYSLYPIAINDAPAGKSKYFRIYLSILDIIKKI